MEERRQTLLANPAFQLRWILSVVLAGFVLINLILIVAFITAGANFMALDRMLTVAIAVAVAELIAMVIVYLLARRQSSRIAGPLLRVEQVADALKTGDLTVSASIRDTDYFHDELRRLDQAVENLRERIQAAQVACDNDGTSVALREQLSWFRTR